MKSVWRHTLALVFLWLLFYSIAESGVDTAWVRRDSPGIATAIALDGSNNVCVTGYIPDQYCTIKYYPNGDTAWVRLHGGEAYAVAADDSGNVYVTGRVDGHGWRDYGTIKYFANGDTAWVRTYNGLEDSGDSAYAIAVDDSGNVYVTGSSPPYFATIKYRSNGDTAWVRGYPGGYPCIAHAIALDDSGNTYVVGDKSPGYVTIKYLPDGDTAWVRSHESSGKWWHPLHAVAVDDSGNVYVTGSYGTVKYDSNGNLLWTGSWGGNDLDLDGFGNTYVAGGYNTGKNTDYATVKYYPNGDTAWLRTYNGPGNGDDLAYAVAVDSFGNAYVTGASGGDYATIKYYPDGNIGWVARYTGGEAYAIAVDDSLNVYVTGTGYTTIKYVQYDSIPFAPAVNYGAGVYPHTVFCADLDRDDDLDVAVANNGGNDISILKNNGDGTFQTAVNYGTGIGPRSVFCANLDGDGDLDLAVANWGSNNVSILKNDGDGIFQTVVNYGTGDEPQSVFCADLDNDADLDLATGNEGSDNISILKNNGNGTFQTAVNYETGDCPWLVFCADLDGDNDLDLAVANVGSGNISILKNNGDGTFQAKIDYGVGDWPRSVFCADLEADGDLDLVVGNYYSDNVSILMNNGEGTFQTAVSYGVGNYPYSVFCADLDGDSDLDLAVANYDSYNVSILKNNGDGTFKTAVNYGASIWPFSVFCGDLDGDTDLDLAVANWGDGVSIVENLTQVLANQPPWAFPLISPTNGDTVYGTLTFHWQIPYDPNFGDQFRYDLYISTSAGFEPLYTIIDSNLHMSKFTAVLDTGTYYWKVKAKDNWGAETWSAEIWSFTALLALPLDLDPGWQWISFNIDPVPSEIESIFVDCWSGHLDLIKAEDGSFCIPDQGCWIPGWDVLKMYEIHMADACTIGIRGSKAQVDTEIPLEAGWNYFGYLPDCPLEPETALVSIWDNLELVKNNDGDFCIPGIVCNIEFMQENEGYKGHLSVADTLVYPTDCPPCPPLFAKRVNALGFDETSNPKDHPQCETPEHFVFKGNTGDSYPVVIDSAILDGLGLEECDEIGVFADTGDAKGLLCVGASVYHPADLPVPLTAWKDDPFTPERDGYLAGDSMYFKVWSYGQEREEYGSSHYEVGNGLFEFGIYSKLWLSAPVVGPPDFAMEASPDSQDVQATGYVEYEVILTSLHGFSSSCTLTVEGVPDEASAFFDPEVLTPTDTSVLTVNTFYTTPPGTYRLTLIGTEMGGKGAQQSVEVKLVVTPAPDFEMQADPEDYEIQVGDSAIFDLKLTSLFGFDSPCTLWVSGIPPDASFELDDIFLVPTDSTVLRISTQYSTPPGEYEVTVTAQEMGGSFIQHSIDLTLEVLHADTLWVVAYSPVDLIVTDPIGDSIGLEFNTIQDASYDTLMDLNEDGDKDDLVTIPHCLVGEYLVRVISEPGAAPGDSYSLSIRIDGGSASPPVHAPAPPPGESDDYLYLSLPYLRGDANGDNATNLGDVIFELNYLFRSGPAPDPLELGDVNCNGIVDLGDVIYLLNYLFKGGDPPCS